MTEPVVQPPPAVTSRGFFWRVRGSQRDLPENRRRSRRLLVSGAILVLVSVSAIALWPSLRVTASLTEARRALSVGDVEAAIPCLERARRLQPDRAAVQYLLAVAKRRNGQLDEFAQHLQRAEELGWDQADIERQAWLARASKGISPTSSGSCSRRCNPS